MGFNYAPSKRSGLLGFLRVRAFKRGQFLAVRPPRGKSGFFLLPSGALLFWDVVFVRQGEEEPETKEEESEAQEEDYEEED